MGDTQTEVVTVVRLGVDVEAYDDDAVDVFPPAVVRDGSEPTSATPAAAAAAGIAVLVPFREDGTGRTRQLSALVARLATLFPAPGQCVVVVAEQSQDERRFNRG
jgi:hypothetical protein